MTADVEPFGTYALSAPRRWMQYFAGGTKPSGYGIARLRYSIFRRAVHWGRKRRPIDVEFFDGVRARLYIWDNTTDRLVYRAADYWDFSERSELAARVHAHDGAEPFVFLDIGANSGFYSLWLVAQARKLGKKIRVLAIEPDPINRERLAFNIAASDAADIVAVERLAVSDAKATGAIVSEGVDRGSNKLVSASDVTDRSQVVETDLLSNILAKHGIKRVDALKIDIEGGEMRALSPYFQSEPSESWPRFVVTEAHADNRAEIVGLFERHGFVVHTQGKVNFMFALPEEIRRKRANG